MNPRRRLLLALLLYVTSDLSLPAMPGAFVFDAGDSVESVQARRDSSTAQPILLPAPSSESAPTPAPARIIAAAPVPGTRRAAPHATLARRRPGAAADAPRSSEDPH